MLPRPTSPRRPPARARDRSAGAPAARAGADQHLHSPQHAARVRAPALRRRRRARRRAAGLPAVSVRTALPRQAGVGPDPRQGRRSSAPRTAGREKRRATSPASARASISGGPIVLHGIPAATGRELSWILEETPALSRFRTDLPAHARVGAGGSRRTRRSRRRGTARGAAPLGRLPRRRRTGRRAATVRSAALRFGIATGSRRVRGVDTDAWIHPPLIRFLAGYLDQGLAHWSMPERARGIHGCFLELYDTSLAAHCGPWARPLPHLVADDRAAGRNALARSNTRLPSSASPTMNGPTT